MGLISQLSNPHPATKPLKRDGIVALAADNPPLLPLTFLDIVVDGECRWPIDGSEEWSCCGRATHASGPYCLTHHLRSYVKPRHITDQNREILHEQGVIKAKKKHSALTLILSPASAEELGL